MKLLILDFWFGKTHQRTNKRTLQILSGISSLLVTNYKGYYENGDVDGNIEYIEVKCHNANTSKLRQRLRSMYNIYESWKAVKNRTDYDAILVTGYEVISVAFMFLLFKTDKPIFLQYHQHVDEVSNRVKRFFFNFYKEKAYHVFLEESFASFFKEITHVKANRIYVVHHFIMDKINENTNEGDLVLGISSSNDESVIERLIREERDNCLLKNNGIYMQLRSREHIFDDGYLKVDNNYLSAKEYKELYDTAGIILVIPKKEEFHHRVSGLIYDALSSGKKVIGINIEIMRIMNHYAPTMFYILDEGQSIVDLVNTVMKKRISDNDLQKIRRRHSDERIRVEYRKMFDQVLRLK